jgi:hypothetical protein
VSRVRSPEAIARRRDLEKQRRQKPEVKARIIEQGRKHDAKRRADPAARAKRSARSLRYYAERKDDPAFKQRRGEWQRKTLYGITEAERLLILERQGRACAICRKPAVDGRGRTQVVDHDHVTGRVRGILCAPCNSALGQLGDDEAGILHVLAYLRSGDAPRRHTKPNRDDHIADRS